MVSAAGGPMQVRSIFSTTKIYFTPLILLLIRITHFKTVQPDPWTVIPVSLSRTEGRTAALFLLLS